MNVTGASAPLLVSPATGLPALTVAVLIALRRFCSAGRVCSLESVHSPPFEAYKEYESTFPSSAPRDLKKHSLCMKIARLRPLVLLLVVLR